MASDHHFLIQGKPTAHAALSNAQSAVGEVGSVTTVNTINVQDSWIT